MTALLPGFGQPQKEQGHHGYLDQLRGPSHRMIEKGPSRTSVTIKAMRANTSPVPMACRLVISRSKNFDNTLRNMAAPLTGPAGGKPDGRAVYCH